MKMDARYPITVLQLTSSGQECYGMERVIVTLAKHLDQRFFDVRIACIERKKAKHSPMVPVAHSAGLKVQMVPCRGRFDWATVKSLTSLVKTNNIDILHCHSTKSRLYGVLVSRLTGIPIVATQHGLTPLSLALRVGGFIDIGSLNLCDKVVTVASRGLKSMGCALIPSRRIEIITNGIDLEEFGGTTGASALKASLGIPGGMPVIGTVGRLTSEKGHELLIEAARRLTDMGQEAAYLIVGEGAELSTLQSLTRNLGLVDRIFFVGYQRDVRPFLDITDIFVLPSRTEGTPMALLEAMSRNRPVVATAVGGVPDIVSNGVNGIVLRERDATELAQALLALMSDTGLAKRLADEGRRRVELEYSAPRMAERYASVYRECFNSHSRSATSISGSLSVKL